MTCTCIFNNKNNWGPVLWNILHNIPVLLKSINDIDRVVEFVQNFYHILPCSVCQDHCREYLTLNAIILRVRNDLLSIKKDLMLYMYNFHNYVNNKNGKQTYPGFDIFLSTPLPLIDYNIINKVFNNSQNKLFYDNLTEPAKIYKNNFITTLKSL